MIVFVNDKSEIHDVGSTKDPLLTPLYIIDEGNPFNGWSVAKICCYKCAVSEGVVTMFTPYVDSNLIEHIDQLGKQAEAATPYTDTKTAYITDSEVVFFDVPEGALLVSFSNGNKDYTVTRLDTSLKVEFEPLDEVITITIKVQ